MNYGDEVVAVGCVVWLSETGRRGMSSASGSMELPFEIAVDPDSPGKTFRLELSDGRQCDILITGTKALFEVTGGFSGAA